MLFDEYLRNCSESGMKVNRWFGWRENWKIEKEKKMAQGSEMRKGRKKVRLDINN